MSRHQLWIGGKFVDGKDLRDVHSPFSGKTVAQVVQATEAQLEEALECAAKSFQVFRKTSRFARAKLLLGMAQGIEERRADLVECLVQEAGKPLSFSDAEVSRAIMTFTLASEEAKRMVGEVIPVDLDAAGRAYDSAVSTQVPRGPVLAISPFNFPLNLVAHKVAPALAVGASVLLKPPPQAPGASKILAEIFEKAAKAASDARDQIPLGAFQVLSASNDVMSRAVTDSRISVFSFTGSDHVGWMLQGKAIKKKVVMELGGNAAVIIHSDADLKRAALRCAFGGFAYAGQICISVQRIFVHKSVAKAFQDEFLKEVAKLKVGDPSEKDTVVGPMIDEGNAVRVSQWIKEAQNEGAELLVGGERKGSLVTPAVLKNVAAKSKLNTEEVFGPVVILDSYETIGEAITKVNSSRFGLQAGVFTDTTSVAREVSENLDAGGILINEVPTYRADNLPYGGMKESGLGREGVRFAMAEFCDYKTVLSWRG